MNQDPSMRRLIKFREQSNKEGSRPTIKPQVIKSGQKSDQEESDPELEHDEDGDVIRRRHRHREVIDAEENDDENADENIERRHELLKQRMRKLELESAPDEAFSDDNDNDDEDDDGFSSNDSSEDIDSSADSDNGSTTSTANSNTSAYSRPLSCSSFNGIYDFLKKNFYLI